MSSFPTRPRLQFAPPGAFSRAVNRRVQEFFAQSGDHRYGDRAQELRTAGLVGLSVAAYVLLLMGAGGRVGGNVWIVAGLIAVAAFGAFMLIVQVGHDAAHGAISPHGIVNRIALFVTFGILGVDGRLWRDRHVRLHHTAANLPGTGIDADSMTIMRLAPDKPWRRLYRLQPLYVPVLYALGHFSLAWIEDIAGFRAARAAGHREFIRRGAGASFIGGKAVHLALFLVLPAFALHPNPIALMLGYLLASAVIAIAFATLVIGTHVSDLAAFPQPDAAGNLPHDWATHQFMTSVDWAPANAFAVLASGGANAHVAHHLFPGYNHRHMAWVSRIIAKTAAEHGVAHQVTTFRGMVASQWRHIVALSRPI
jgi:linoleoyl-CoA desaturase